MTGILTIVGDSNVRRHMNSKNCRDPQMSSAQVKTCGNISALAEVLRSVRAETTVCVLACVTNFLTGSEGSSSSAGLRVQPQLQDFREIVLDFCSEQPERFVLLLFVHVLGKVFVRMA